MLYVSSEGQDEPAHPCSLICAFSFCRHVLQYPLILLAENEGQDNMKACAYAQADQGLRYPQIT